MTRIVSILAFSILTVSVFAQSPDLFNYQGVARDNGGNILANQNIGLQLSLHSGSSSGTVVYSETQVPTTNQFGLFSVKVGAGTVVSGNMTTVDWGGTSFFLQVEMDPSGGTAYQNLGTAQLLSVPYALYAETAGNPGPAGPTGSQGAQAKAQLVLKVFREHKEWREPQVAKGLKDQRELLAMTEQPVHKVQLELMVRMEHLWSSRGV